MMVKKQKSLITIQFLDEKEGVYIELNTDFLGEFLQQSLMNSILKFE